MTKIFNLEPFQKAVKEGDVEKVGRLSKESDAQLVMADSNFALFQLAALSCEIAVAKNSDSAVKNCLDIVNILLKSASPWAKWDMINSHDFCKLFKFAAENGHFELVQGLLSAAELEQKKGEMISYGNFSAFKAVLDKVHLGKNYVDIAVKLLEESETWPKQKMISSCDFCQLFKFAAENGHFELMDELLASESLRQKEQMIASDDFFAFKCVVGHAFKHAARSEGADAMIRLNMAAKILKESHRKQKKLVMACHDFCQLFKFAAENGHLELVDELLSAANEEQKQAMIASDGFFAFKCAIEKGYFDIAARLLQKADGAPQKQQMLAACDFYLLFKNAAENRHLDLVAEILRAVGFEQKKELIACVDFHAIFKLASENGRLYVTDEFLRLAGEVQKQEVLASDNFAILMQAAKNGHFDIVARILQETDHNQRQRIIAENDFYIFKQAAFYGRADIVTQFLQEVDPRQKQEMLTSDDFAAFRAAIENNHLHLAIKILEQVLDSGQRRNMVASNYFGIFRRAVINGHVDIVDMVLQNIGPALKQSVLTGNGNNDLFCEVAKNGDLRMMVKLFQELDPGLRHLVLSSGDFVLVKHAAGNGHLDVVEELLKNASDDPVERRVMIRYAEHYAFQYITRSGDFNFMNKFLEEIIDQQSKEAAIRADGFHILKLAASSGNIDLIVKVLEDADLSLRQEIFGVITQCRHKSPQTKNILNHILNFSSLKGELKENPNYKLKMDDFIIEIMRKISVEIDQALQEEALPAEQKEVIIEMLAKRAALYIYRNRDNIRQARELGRVFTDSLEEGKLTPDMCAVIAGRLLPNFDIIGDREIRSLVALGREEVQGEGEEGLEAPQNDSETAAPAADEGGYNQAQGSEIADSEGFSETEIERQKKLEMLCAKANQEAMAVMTQEYLVPSSVFYCYGQSLREFDHGRDEAEASRDKAASVSAAQDDDVPESEASSAAPAQACTEMQGAASLSKQKVPRIHGTYI